MPNSVMTARFSSHKSLCIAFASSSRQEISLNANILPWTYFVNLRQTLFDYEFENFWLGWTRDCLKMGYRWKWSSRLNDNDCTVSTWCQWQGSILVLYKTNNECLFIRAMEQIFSFGERWNVPFNSASPRWMEHFIFYLMKIFVPLHS